MKFYNCPKCKTRVFFENLLCLHCKTELGYVYRKDDMVAMKDCAASGEFIHCANREMLFCNWLINVADTRNDNSLCACCRYTRTIPSQQQPENRVALRKLEQAKRYLFYSLYALGLPLPDRIRQPVTGLAFDFLMQPPGQKILTGHTSGVITINAAEADDAKREQRRVSLNEAYRTVLGHLRHEIGHFYWEQLIAHSAWLEKFRVIFGDERVDYESSLKNYYQRTDLNDWHDQFISYYATAHPWEDWAETWAHYLHIHDALDTADAWKVVIANDNDENGLSSDDNSAQWYRKRLIGVWLPLSQYLNAACRSLGESDAYPFTLQEAVIEKLVFIHDVIRGIRATDSVAVR